MDDPPPDLPMSNDSFDRGVLIGHGVLIRKVPPRLRGRYLFPVQKRSADREAKKTTPKMSILPFGTERQHFYATVATFFCPQNDQNSIF